MRLKTLCMRVSKPAAYSMGREPPRTLSCETIAVEGAKEAFGEPAEAGGDLERYRARVVGPDNKTAAWITNNQQSHWETCICLPPAGKVKSSEGSLVLLS